MADDKVTTEEIDAALAETKERHDAYKGAVGRMTGVDRGVMAEPAWPSYRSHKVVQALQILEVIDASSFDDGDRPVGEITLTFSGFPSRTLGADDPIFARTKPVDGDYLVRYADGYESFSPRKAFEEGYTLVDLRPVPSIGRIVHYTLSDQDASSINRRREHARLHMLEHQQAQVGVQLHVGNDACEGEVFPLIITKVWGSAPDCYVNGQVLLDGNDLLWATSVKLGTGPGTFSWPARG